MSSILPPGTRIMTPEEVAERRRRREAERVTAKGSKSRNTRRRRTIRVKVPGTARPHLGDFTPTGSVRYAQQAPVSAILVLFGLLVLLSSIRRGRLPNRQRMAGLVLAAMVFVLFAAVAPGFVATLLGAGLILEAIDAMPYVTAAMGRIQKLLAAGGPGISKQPGG